MQTFYLYVEDRSWIYFYTVVFFDVSCKTFFVLELDRHEFFQSLFVIQPFLQSAHLGQICNPLFCAELFCYPVSKQRVRMHEETSLCDTIGLVVELLRHHLIEVFQFLILQNLCMQLCNTIDRITCNDCKVCHLHLAVHQDCHLLNLFFITRILCSYLRDETAVDFLDDLVNTRKQS